MPAKNTKSKPRSMCPVGVKLQGSTSGSEAPVETADSPAGVVGGNGIDPVRHRIITFSDLARIVPGRRGGRPTHLDTVHRWRLRGIKGVKLPAIRIGGSWYTSLEAYREFCDALTQLSGPPASPSLPPTPAGRDHTRTEQLLDALGFAPPQPGS